MSDTVDGKEPLLYRQMAVKRIHKDLTDLAVIDVVVCQNRDRVTLPSDYILLRYVELTKNRNERIWTLFFYNV